MALLRGLIFRKVVLPLQGGSGDPQWSNVVLLLNGDDLTDSSSFNRMVTNVGSASVDTGTKKYGSGSLSFNGNNHLEVPGGAHFDFGTGDFTIEFWLNLSAVTTGSWSGGFITTWHIGGANSGNGWSICPSGNSTFDIAFGGMLNSSTNYVMSGIDLTPYANQWVHYAVVRTGATLTQYLNGVSKNTYNIGATTPIYYPNTNPSVWIGAWGTGYNGMTGKMDDVRITKGIARYTANFTPPTEALSLNESLPRISIDKQIRTSNLVGLSSTATLVGSDYVVTDASGNQWKIAANFGYGTTAPTRWNGVVWKDVSKTTDVVNRSTAQIAGTTMNASDVLPGFYRDAVTFTNASGPGFSNWYSDSKNNQAYPAINTAITNSKATANVLLDSTSSQSADSNGGTVWWIPPVGTSEVMIDFANSHSNGPCSIVVWNKATQSVVYSIFYGQPGTVNTASGALNDANSRTVTFHHNADYVYFNTDHAGTIAGSHYYLYR